MFEYTNISISDNSSDNRFPVIELRSFSWKDNKVLKSLVCLQDAIYTCHVKKITCINCIHKCHYSEENKNIVYPGITLIKINVEMVTIVTRRYEDDKQCFK